MPFGEMKIPDPIIVPTVSAIPPYTVIVRFNFVPSSLPFCEPSGFLLLKMIMTKAGKYQGNVVKQFYC